METFEAESLINASLSTVWDIITDDSNYTLWNSGITRIEGDVRDGQIIRVRTVAGGRRTYPLHVLQIPGQSMTWISNTPLGLCKRVVTFTVYAHPESTRLNVTEEVSGVLRRPLRKAVPGMGPGVCDFVAAVKTRAEVFGWR